MNYSSGAKPTAAGDYIFKPAKESMEKHLLTNFKNKIQILPSQLKPGDAAIVGASALVHQELKKRKPINTLIIRH